jgi:hypothetical protein
MVQHICCLDMYGELWYKKLKRLCLVLPTYAVTVYNFYPQIHNYIFEETYYARACLCTCFGIG